MIEQAHDMSLDTQYTAKGMANVYHSAKLIVYRIIILICIAPFLPIRALQSAL